LGERSGLRHCRRRLIFLGGRSGLKLEAHLR
jgi:hypothetical protein